MNTRRKGKCNKLVKLFCLLMVATIVFMQPSAKVLAEEDVQEEQKTTAPIMSAKGYAKVASVLNVREEPNTSSQILAKLEPGEIVTIFLTPGNEWFQIQTAKGVVGFVKSDYLEIGYSKLDSYELISVAVITKTDGSSENRNFNMARAASFINGIVLKPGEEFAWYSTSKTEGIVGPANKENGYKKAPIILNGESAMGYGGGVCQVSTAVYNCIYKIGILPTQHHHHTLESSYVAKGMDATVSFPGKNFVFTNTKDYSIVFFAYTDGPQVVVEAYKILED